MNIPEGIKQVAVLTIITREDEMLLLKRDKEPHIGKYIPIGGRVDAHEAPEDAAVRETKEETGIELDNVNISGLMTETSPTDFNWVNYIYTSSVNSVSTGETDEGTLEWIQEKEISDIPTPETDRHIYNNISKDEFFVFDARYREVDDGVELVELRDELNKNTLIHSEAE